MGVSFVKLERWSDARDAFRRLVNVDEEDAEGWNNLAAVYLRIGEEGLSKDQVRYTWHLMTLR
jgi:Flp pilus assembly protein TadD